MLAHILHRACGHARAAVRAIRRRLGSALRPATTSSLVLGVATDLVRGKAELVAENALLRQQVIVLRRSTKRPRISRSDRALLVLLASRVRAWRQALLIVQPAPLLRWHRAGFRLLWRWRSAPRSNQPRYIARTRPAAAARIAARIVAAADRLETYPHYGRVASWDETGRLRELPVARTPFVVLYTIDAAAEAVLIVRVVHGAQLRGRE